MADKHQQHNEGADTQTVPTCPVGESQCCLIDELVSLREAVTELEQQTRTDGLTQLYNFKHFTHCLALEMERTRRTAQTTALLMIDLDYFKQVNDDWGHEAGNQALVATANVIKSSVRQLDIACRYGGEEFAIILPATDLLVALKVAERIRSGIESAIITIDDKLLHLTASLGVDVYFDEDDNNPQIFVDRVDSLLYRAKEQGRNQICHGSAKPQGSDVAVTADERSALSDLFGENDDV